MPCEEQGVKGTDQPLAADFFNIRQGRISAPGLCLYVQSGDPTDFDGYYIAAAGAVVARHTPDCKFVVVMPERRACNNLNETDPMTHMPEYSERILDTVGSVVRHLCPNSMLIRGPLNERSVIPIKFAFNEPAKYGPLLEGRQQVAPGYRSLDELASMVHAAGSLAIDVMGSMGYLAQLAALVGEEMLGAKIKASGIPIVIMSGVLAEVKTLTMELPGRDPRATLNSIYSPSGMAVLLRMARANDIPLLFVTINVCNLLAKYEDAGEVVQKLSLQGTGLLEEISNAWYSMPHLKGKCVPFDCVAFCALLLAGRRRQLINTEERELYVGDTDPSVLVLAVPGAASAQPIKPAANATPAEQEQAAILAGNLASTHLWGRVQSLTGFTDSTLTQLAKTLAKEVHVA